MMLELWSMLAPGVASLSSTHVPQPLPALHVPFLPVRTVPASKFPSVNVLFTYRQTPLPAGSSTSVHVQSVSRVELGLHPEVYCNFFRSLADDAPLARSE